jgi:biopolymer transport protein ExbB
MPCHQAERSHFGAIIKTYFHLAFGIRAKARSSSSRSLLLLSILQAAGWPIIPLVLCSIVALALVIERFLSLRESRVAPNRLVDEVISVTRSSLPPADTINKLSENSTLGQLLAQGLRAAAAESRISEANLRGAFESAGRDAVHQMERNLNALGTIASAAPLLGLLGTVIGMIEIFGASGASTGTAGANPMELAHGISVALYNTAFGLIVAIPSLMFYRHFRARIEGYTLAMEQAAERMVPHLLRLTHGRR